MGTVAVSSFFSRITPEIPGCPEPMLQQAVVDTCIDFCEETLAVIDTLPQINGVANQTDYTLTFDTDTELSRVVQAYWKQYLLVPLPLDLVGDPSFYVTSVTDYTPPRGRPQYFTHKNLQSITVYPAPPPNTSENFTNALTVVIASKPTRTAQVVDDKLFGKYADSIVAGAKMRLFSMSAMPWANPQMAKYNEILYNYGISETHADSLRGNARGVLSVSIPKIT